jgi:predicted MFS family arabinose efflux permease
MVCAGLALLSAGMFSERIGWKKVFILGVAASCVGLVTGGTATSLVGLIVARGVAGFGFGLVLMAAQIGTLTKEKAGSGLAGVFAGIFSGSICGSAAGALLAERVGFDVVFYVAAALVPLAIPPLLFGESTRTDSPTVLTKAKTGASAAAWKFLRDSRMHLLLGMIGIPAALCLTGFLHYMLPLMLSDAQATQSDIGRVFMLYGLCFITVGPVIGKWLDHSGDKSLFTMFTGLFSGAALLVAAASSSLIATGFAVVLIGIAQCLAAPSTMLCVIGLGSAQRLGPGKTASIYRTLERVGQVLGPILFGLAMVRFGMPQTLAVAGAGAGALAILFFGVWRFRRPKA